MNEAKMVIKMVQAVIVLDEHHNRVINVVKGKYGLKNKSQAINHIIDEYEKELLEPELRPEYIEKMKEREKEDTVEIRDFNKHFGLE